MGSAERPSEYPRWTRAEIAVAGRSNAGKSSLLNRIAGERLARVSRTPGRTQRIHFLASKRSDFALVDLPGYGFARAPAEARARWGAAVEAYVSERENLRALCLLLDVRRDPEDEEAMIAELAVRRGLTLVRVATKVDKLGRAERERRLGSLAKATAGGRWIPFSAETGEGAEALCAAFLEVARGS